MTEHIYKQFIVVIVVVVFIVAFPVLGNRRVGTEPVECLIVLVFRVHPFEGDLRYLLDEAKY